MPSLTPQQDKVLNLIASGLSATAAARQAGVHRHTVANWLKLDEFCEALEMARHHKQILLWDQALALVSEAVADLRQLKQDPAASPSVRLRAIALLLKHGQMHLPGDSVGMGLPDPPEPGPQDAASPQPVPAPNQIMDQNIENMSKNGQSNTPACPGPALPTQRPAEIPESDSFERFIRGKSQSTAGRPTPVPAVVAAEQLCDELEKYLKDNDL
jgi:hypothetical protein